MGSRTRSIEAKPSKASGDSLKKAKKSKSKAINSRDTSKSKNVVGKANKSKRISKKARPQKKISKIEEKKLINKKSKSPKQTSKNKQKKGLKAGQVFDPKKTKNINVKTGKYEDLSFPPNEVSLIGQYPMPDHFRSCKWERISDVIKNPEIFKGQIEPNDISQGLLGDCYFLAAIAALAQKPKRIKNLFIYQTVNKQMHFRVKMLYQGKWTQIDLDEWIVTDNRKPAFTASKEGQLWCILLEKAWAKLYSSFMRIDGGFPSEALHDLTGAPIRFFRVNNYTKQQAWSYLFDSSLKDYSIVAASNSGSDRDLSNAGIAQGHAYTVLNATILKIGEKQERVVQLRNPWGSGQSNIRLSDFDLAWSKVSQEEKKRIGFKPNRNDGIFFMYYQDFLKQFSWFQSVEVRDNANYVSLSARDPGMTGVYFAIKIKTFGLYCLQIAKPPQRGYNDRIQRFYSYPLTELTVKNAIGNKLHSSAFDSQRVMFHQKIFTPGTYIVKAVTHYNPRIETQFDVNLAVYSDQPCQVSFATRKQAMAFEQNNNNILWTGNPKKSSPLWHVPGNRNYLNNLQKK